VLYSSILSSDPPIILELPVNRPREQHTVTWIPEHEAEHAADCRDAICDEHFVGRDGRVRGEISVDVRGHGLAELGAA
jgi:hypothetical protein